MHLKRTKKYQVNSDVQESKECDIFTKDILCTILIIETENMKQNILN